MSANDNQGIVPKPFNWDTGTLWRNKRPLRCPVPANDNYEIVLADPPWSYYGSRHQMGAAGRHYPLMSDAALMAMPVGDLLSPRGLVFVWTTSSMAELSIACLKSWGLRYRGIAFVWVKTRRDGTPLRARGVRPSIIKPITELVIVGSRVARGRPLPVADESICQTVFAPCGAHSAKPVEVYWNIERLYPGTRRLELFARGTRRGWDSWGDQVS